MPWCCGNFVASKKDNGGTENPMKSRKRIIKHMRKYIYLAPYVCEGGMYYFLIAQKRETARFYGSIIKPSPIKIHHGPNSWCFPGGEIDYNEKIIYAALREFKEETGIQCWNYHLPIDIIIDSQKSIEVTNEEELQHYYQNVIQQYAVVFIYIPTLRQLESQIKNNFRLIENLTQQNINNSGISDDELCNVLLATKNNCLENFNISDRNTTGWFVDALNFFTREVLG